MMGSLRKRLLLMGITCRKCHTAGIEIAQKEIFAGKVIDNFGSGNQQDHIYSTGLSVHTV